MAENNNIITIDVVNEVQAEEKEKAENQITESDIVETFGDWITPDPEKKVAVERPEGDILDFMWSALYTFGNTVMSGNMLGSRSGVQDKFLPEGSGVSPERIHEEFSNHAKNMRVMQINKVKAIENIQKDIEKSSGLKKTMYAISAALADQSTQSYPQIAQTFGEDSVASNVYTSFGVGLGLIKNTGLSFLAGGSLPALASFQAFDSSATMYNAMEETRQLNPESDIDPAIYGVAAGVATGLSFGLSEIFSKYAINKILQKQAVNVWQRAASGSIRNGSEYIAEHFIRNTGLSAGGQEQLDFNAYGLLTAITMGAVMDVARERYYLEMKKSDPISFKNDMRNMVNKFSKFKGKAKDANISPTANPEIDQPIMPANTADVEAGEGNIRHRDLYVHNLSESETKGLQTKVWEQVWKEVDESVDVVNVDHAVLIEKMKMDSNSKTTIDVNTKSIGAKKSAEVRASMDEVAVQNVKNSFRGIPTEDMLRKRLSERVNNTGGVFRNYFDSITKGNFEDVSSFTASVHSQIDQLDLGTHTKNNLKSIFDVEDPNMLKHLTDPESRDTKLNTLVEETHNIIDETANFEIFHDVYKTVRQYADPFVKDMPAFADIVNEKTKLTQDEYNGLLHKYGRLYSEFSRQAVVHERKAMSKMYQGDSLLKGSDKVMSELSQNADFIHSFSADPNVKHIASSLFKTINGMSSIESNLSHKGLKFLNDYSRYLDKNGLDKYKIRSYLDELNDSNKLGNKVTFEEIEIEGYRTPIAVDIANKLQMKPKELIAAHKLANGFENVYRIHDMSQTHLPQDYATHAFNLPDFDQIDPTYIGNSYHPRRWNKEGANVIREKHNIEQDVDVITSQFKPRTYNNMFRYDEYRLDPFEEISINFASTKNSITSGSIYKQINKLKLKRFGSNIVDRNGKVLSMEAYMKTGEDIKLDPIAEQIRLMENQMSDIGSERIDHGFITNTADLVVGTVANTFTKYVLSPVNPWFHAANTVQFLKTLKQHVGLINAYKGVPTAYGAAAKFMFRQVESGFNLQKALTKEVTSFQGKNTEFGDITARYLVEGYSANQMRDHVDVLNTRGVFEEAISMRKHVSDKAFRAAQVLQKATDKLSITMVAGDYGSRVGGLFVSDKYMQNLLDSYIPKFKTAKTVEEGIRLRREFDIAAHFDTLGSTNGKNLRDIATKSFETGDFKELRYQYAKASVDFGMFQYGKYNKSKIADSLRKYGHSPALVSRFRSWGMYDRLNIRRAAKNMFDTVDYFNEYRAAKASGNIEDAKSARNKTFLSAKPLVLILGSMATAYGIEEFMSEIPKENTLKRLVSNLVVGREWGYRTTNTVEQLTRDPSGVLSASLNLMEGMFAYGKDFIRGDGEDNRTRFEKGQDTRAKRKVESLNPKNIMKIIKPIDFKEFYSEAMFLYNSLNDRINNSEEYSEQYQDTSDVMEYLEEINFKEIMENLKEDQDEINKMINEELKSKDK